MQFLLDKLENFAKAGPNDDFWFAMSFLVFATVSCFFYAFRFLRRKRVITDTPTSKIRSAAQGYVELSGQGKYLEGESLRSPLTGTPCIWYEVRVDKRAMGLGSDRHHWKTIMEDTSGEMFTLQDETGECLIAPEGAKVTVNDEGVWYGNKERPPRRRRPPGARKRNSIMDIVFGGSMSEYQYTERLIREYEKVYAIGLFETVGGANAGNNTKQEVLNLIREWKKNSAELIEKFDKNKDGKIDMEEWQEIRKAAYKEIMAKQKEQPAQAPVNLIRKTNDKRRPFLLSSVDQDALVRKLHYSALGCFIGFALCGMASVMLIAMRYSG